MSVSRNSCVCEQALWISCTYTGMGAQGWQQTGARWVPAGRMRLGTRTGHRETQSSPKTHTPRPCHIPRAPITIPGHCVSPPLAPSRWEPLAWRWAQQYRPASQGLSGGNAGPSSLPTCTWPRSEAPEAVGTFPGSIPTLKLQTSGNSVPASLKGAHPAPSHPSNLGCLLAGQAHAAETAGG